MTLSLAAIDPFYAACLSMAASPAQAEPDKPIYARLPRIPVNASPVPHLTSLYHFQPCRRIWRPRLSGQLRRQSHQRPAALLQAEPGIRPHERQRNLPRRVRGTRHPLHVVGHPPRHRRLRPAGLFSIRGVRLHLGASALLADEALRRRSARPVPRPDAGCFPAALPAVHSQLRRRAQARRQARHPDGRL